jgi:phage shock protein C
MHKRLYRSKKRILGGVLGGLAEYFGHDPLLWRLGFIVILFLTGFMPFTLIYLIAWVIIPPVPVVEPLTKEDYTETAHE